MRKKKILMMLALLCAVVQGAGAWDGSGTQADPYQISSADDWNALASAVDGGESYSGTYFKLTKDIDKVETMVGSSKDKAFKGYFYGNGKTLAAYYNTSEPYTAPFRYINGATITDLTVDGIIWTSAQFAGGLVSVANGSNFIAGCRISVAMYSEVNGEGSHGGVVAHIDGGLTTIDNCLFDYWLLGSETTNCGGFVGWCNTNSGASVMITNCFFNPSQVTMSGSGSKAFVRYSGANRVRMDRCYYADHTFGLGQGESRKGFGTADILEDLGDGWKIENEKLVPAMNVSNIACAYVTGMKLRYQHTGSAVDINYTVMSADGKVLTKGTDYTAEITHNTVPTDPVIDQGYYKLTLTGKGAYSGTKTLTFNVENPTNLADINIDYEIQDGEIVTGTLSKKVKISIAPGATITLSGITILGEDDDDCLWAGLTCLGDATIMLAEGTENTVRAFYHTHPGIFIPENYTLTIDGSGTLNAAVNECSYDFECCAAIGGRYKTNSGNIIIKGGIINATSHYEGPGIGSGNESTGGFIRIEGGTVYAKSGKRTSAIGCGLESTVGDIIITQDATVKAECYNDKDKNKYRSIGYYHAQMYKSSIGTITIGCTLDADGNPVGGHVGEISTNPFTYFRYTIAYDGEGVDPATESVERGFDSNLTLASDLTREGYTFMGWVGENGGKKKFYPGGTKYSDLDVEPRTTITLTAQWMKGEGTAEAPYEIATDGDWLTMAHYINDGDGTYNSKHYKLMADINVSETVNKGETPASMIGTAEDNAFSGTFDGDGHTLTLSITDERDEHYCAPFRFINGATIENLHVAGTIAKTKKKHAGGIVGQAFGTNTITNCRSSVDIQANTDGDGSHGGFIGDLRGGTTTLTGCTFDGRMRGPGGAKSRTTKWGGLIGWVADGKKAVLNTCVFAPTEVNLKSKSDSRTFARRDDGDDVTLTNCYYFETLGSAQGKQIYSISGDEHVSVAFSTIADIRYEVSGIDSHESGAFIKFDDMMYSVGGKNVYLTLSQVGKTPEGYNEGFFIATPGSQLTKPELSAWYLLKMPNTNVTIGLLPVDWAGSGSEYDPYLIYNTGQWNMLVSRVHSGENSGYNGKFFQLMADITLTETHASGNSNVMMGISSSDNTKFRGTFDGNAHTITLDITDNSSDDYCAPFRYIKGATIKNLRVDGTIVKTDKKNAGGLVGKAEGNNTISGCRSSVDILFNDEGDCSSGGFIGELREGGTTNMTNCLFDGKLRGTEAYSWGGFVGWVASGNTVTFTNCLFAPAETAFDINDGNDNSKTFARKDGTATITNCYYKTLIKDAQDATDATNYNTTQLRDSLGDAWEIIGSEVLPVMGLYGFDGEGTQGSPYVIASTGDWDRLASNVAQGELYEGKYFQLATNITVSSMIGSTESLPFPFKGNFDGAGNKLTFNPTATNYYTAPFRFVDGATVENLHVCGTINTLGSYAAGLISYVKGTTTIRNCRSSVTINIVSSSSQHNGGFIAYNPNGTITMTGCLFDGRLQFYNGSRSTNDYSGGFIGTTLGSVQFNDCLFAPTAITNSYSDCGTFTRFFEGDGDYCQINNCYYTQTLGEAQGKLRHSITAGEDVTVENVGYSTVTKYDVSGITGYFPGIVCGGVLYAGSEDDMRLSLDYDVPGYTLSGYTTSSGTLTASGDYYTLAMPDADVTISAVTSKNILTLIDGEDNTDALGEWNGCVADVTLSGRTLYKDGAWNTICLPFDVTIAGSPLAGATARPLTSASIEGTTLNLTFGDAVTTLEAGTPYIIKWTADAQNIENPVFSGVTIDADADGNYDNGVSGDERVRFLGTYKSTAFDAEDKSILLMGGNNTLYYPTAGAGIGAQRAYFKIGDDGALLARRLTAFNIDFGDDEATGIISIENGKLKIDNGVTYDLQGRKYDQKPTRRGVYIVNGKKTVIK